MCGVRKINLIFTRLSVICYFDKMIGKVVSSNGVGFTRNDFE